MHPGAIVGGKYRLDRLIGEGAMGAVWAAIHVETQQPVAVKVVAGPEQLADELCSRLLREARACQLIRHPNVISVTDVGQLPGGAPFMVMQLLSGETLDVRLKREGRLSPVEAARIGAQVARALVAAHAAGIVHRDLKPANIFLHVDHGASQTQVKVLDFGVSKILSERVTGGPDARATATGHAMGSPAYMSPEQAKSANKVDARADLWSLGVVLFEMFAGQLPFPGETAYAVIGEVLHGPIPKLKDVVPKLDMRLADLVARCIVRDPNARVSSAEDIARILEGYLREQTAPQSLDREKTEPLASNRLRAAVLGSMRLGSIPDLDAPAPGLGAAAPALAPAPAPVAAALQVPPAPAPAPRLAPANEPTPPPFANTGPHSPITSNTGPHALASTGPHSPITSNTGPHALANTGPHSPITSNTGPHSPITSNTGAHAIANTGAHAIVTGAHHARPSPNGSAAALESFARAPTTRAFPQLAVAPPAMVPPAPPPPASSQGMAPPQGTPPQAARPVPAPAPSNPQVLGARSSTAPILLAPQGIAPRPAAPAPASSRRWIGIGAAIGVIMVSLSVAILVLLGGGPRGSGSASAAPSDTQPAAPPTATTPATSAATTPAPPPSETAPATATSTAPPPTATASATTPATSPTPKPTSTGTGKKPNKTKPPRGSSFPTNPG
ncbi:MAG: serine/threonine-protein kinase [Polyangiaceae bacterium]